MSKVLSKASLSVLIAFIYLATGHPVWLELSSSPPTDCPVCVSGHLQALLGFLHRLCVWMSTVSLEHQQSGDRLPVCVSGHLTGIARLPTSSLCLDVNGQFGHQQSGDRLPVCVSGHLQALLGFLHRLCVWMSTVSLDISSLVTGYRSGWVFE